MADIVFVTWDGGGNVPPALAIADQLAARGHDIRVLGHRIQRDAIEAAGFEVVPVREARDFTAAGAHSTRELLATFADKGMARDLLAELSRRPADLVVVDTLLLGVLDTVRRAGVRFAVLEHFYDAYLQGALRGPLGMVLRLRGLRPGRALDAAALRVVTSLPELDPLAPDPAVHQVGPVVTWEPRVDDEPGVLVSLSTFGFPGMVDVLQRVVDACAGLPARVVVTTGPHVAPSELRVPAGVEVHRFVPHAALMARSTLLVGHGGHGTTMQALAHDLPVLVLPMDDKTDQPLVGRSLVRAGAGRMLSRTAAVEVLAEAVGELLAPGPHRAAAARLGALVRAGDGALGAALALEGSLLAGSRANGR